MSWKHKLKRAARECYARVLWHSGLYIVVDALMPRRLTILAGHCVKADSNRDLPKDMKIAPEKLEQLVRALGKRFEWVSVGQGVAQLERTQGKSQIALSFDDGYKDNRTDLLPLLQRLGVSATIYLESAPLERRTLNWTHKFFYCLDGMGLERFIEQYLARSQDPTAQAELREQRSSYHLKRVLKYRAERLERTRIVDELFRECGGDERGLCERLYMDWEDVRALDQAGIELGAHTMHHEILSRLDAGAAQQEIAGSKATLEAKLQHPVHSFAYPFGRRWDYHQAAQEAARQAGFHSATTTHAGVCRAHSSRTELPRVMIDEDAQLHLIAAEACGGFELLRRLGLELAE